MKIVIWEIPWSHVNLIIWFFNDKLKLEPRHGSGHTHWKNNSWAQVYLRYCTRFIDIFLCIYSMHKDQQTHTPKLLLSCSASTGPPIRCALLIVHSHSLSLDICLLCAWTLNCFNDLWGWREKVCSYQLASAAPINDQFHTYATHVLPRKGACHYQWPVMSDMRGSCACDRRDWEASRKAKLPDVFCHLFRLPEQAFVLVVLLKGLGVSDCICRGCSLPASSSSWHLKLARLALVHTWNVQATQPCESKLSVSQCRALKRWPVCWTEPHCTILHLEWESEYMIYSLHVFHPFAHCVWEQSFISPSSFSASPWFTSLVKDLVDQTTRSSLTLICPCRLFFIKHICVLPPLLLKP